MVTFQISSERERAFLEAEMSVFFKKMSKQNILLMVVEYGRKKYLTVRGGSS
jgi:hypothetical protein